MKFSEQELPNDFDGIVRLFPLPNVVFFPRVLLPLHIFEPRYRQMTADALERDRLITMILVPPDHQEDNFGRPVLASVACVGQIVADERLDDGRSNILLRGIQRVRIAEEIEQTKLYREARVTRITETVEWGVEKGLELKYLLALMHLAEEWLEKMGIAPEECAKLLDPKLSAPSLCDLLAFALPLPVLVKQQLLEESDVRSRVHQLSSYLVANAPRQADRSSAPQRFPPDFSMN